MKTLIQAHFVHFYLFDYETFDLSSHGTGFIGANGAGKTSLVDGIQVALIGGHGQYTNFNAQSVQSDARSLRDYALGVIRSGTDDGQVTRRKRDEALTYITLVFQGDQPADVISAGICFHSRISEKNHNLLGLYVLPGVHLSLNDHLEEAGEGAYRPISWDLFESNARHQAKLAGRTCTITAKPEVYVTELLHHIRHPGLQINTKTFLRSLSHSLNLKHVGSVGEFLRGYLVEDVSINKQGTLRHMQSLRDLIAQIQEVKLQIVGLQDIEKKYGDLQRAIKRKTSAEATRAMLQLESHKAQLQTHETESIALLELRDKNQSRLDVVLAEIPRKEEEHVHLLRTYSADPDVIRSSHAAEAQKTKQQMIALLMKEAERLQLQIRMALAKASGALGDRRPELATSINALLEHWDGRAKQSQLATQAQFDETRAVLEEIMGEIEKEEENSAKTLATAEAAYTSAMGRLQGAKKGFQVKHDATASAMAAFSSEGIDSRPVGSLVSVTKPKWQVAIESYLRSNRYALVVDPGKEKQAIDILWKRNIREVTVVVPGHVSDFMHRRPAPENVASLIDGDHPVALAFLHQILGNMRQAHTVEDLERYRRALTSDGMMSGNGGTRGLKMLDEDDLILGVKISTDDTNRLQAALQIAYDNRQTAQRVHKLIQDAKSAIQSALQEATSEIFAQALSDYQDGLDEAEKLASSLLPIDQERLTALEGEVKRASEQLKALQKESGDLNAQVQIQDNNFNSLQERSTEIQARVTEIETSLNDMKRSGDFDEDETAKTYTRCYEIIRSDADNGPAQALMMLSKQIKTEEGRIPSMEASVTADFIAFANLHSLVLADERSDWRKALEWISLRIEMLTSSTLADYEDKATKAREAAEASFQSDVKFKIREACQQVKRSIDDLNKVLDSCPAFTGGEKYRFVFTPSPTYSLLHEAIMDVSADHVEGGSFQNPQVQETIATLLENCETGADKKNNPFEDYRLFYNFDLDIQVDGKHVDYLSERMGLASNGEHRVPFYVIAGAALANAYRIKDPLTHKGAGLMIMDEAFYGIDAQNTFATGEFLRSLGLQLVVAGPDTDTGKLMPVLDSYYELIRPRNGVDVFPTFVGIKAKTREKLLSDMPEYNPQLLEQALLAQEAAISP